MGPVEGTAVIRAEAWLAEEQEVPLLPQTSQECRAKLPLVETKGSPVPRAVCGLALHRQGLETEGRLPPS